MRCSDAQNLLPQYADDALPPRQRALMHAHLNGCAACQRELALLHRSLDALNGAVNGAAPDLWASFQARLVAEAPRIACEKVEVLLPTALDDLLDGKEKAAVELHLSECLRCAREKTLLVQSIQALEQAAQNTPPVDLWPAFAARLEQESARPPFWKRLAPAGLLGLLRGPMLQPAFGAAAVLVVVATAGAVLHSSGTARREPQIQIATGSPLLNPAPTASMEQDGNSRADALQKADNPASRNAEAESAVPAPRQAARRTVRDRAGVRARRTRPGRRVGRRTVVASQQPRRTGLETEPAVPRRSRTSGQNLTLAQRAPARLPDNLNERDRQPAAEVNSETAQNHVMPEVVEVMTLLAGVEDRASNPFDVGPDVY